MNEGRVIMPGLYPGFEIQMLLIYHDIHFQTAARQVLSFRTLNPVTNR